MLGLGFAIIGASASRGEEDRGAAEVRRASADPELRERAALSQAADDPTSLLMSLELSDRYVARFQQAPDEQGNDIVVQTTVPFRTGPLRHTARLVLPFATKHPVLDTGLSDITLIDLVVFQQDGWRWGVGPSFLFPSGGHAGGAGKWAAGPALGFTAQAGGFLWGGFNQNLFSFAGSGDRPDVDISVLQPIASYHLGRYWYLSPSPMRFTWSWETDAWVQLPVGARVSKLQNVLDAPIQLAAYYEYDFADTRVGPEHSLQVSVKVLFVRRTLQRLQRMGIL